jgi:kynurenine formamidase
VLGTDAVGWDRPFLAMRQAFSATGDPGEIWDGHFAGREREVFIVQQLDNLAALPPSGFQVGFFPLRLAGYSAAPARVVALVPWGRAVARGWVELLSKLHSMQRGATTVREVALP